MCQACVVGTDSSVRLLFFTNPTRVLLEKRSFSLCKEKPLFVAPLNVHQTEVYFLRCIHLLKRENL